MDHPSAKSWRIQIKNKEGIFDAYGAGLLKDIADLGVNTLQKVQVISVFKLLGDVSPDQIEKICRELLTDPLTQEYCYSEGGDPAPHAQGQEVQVVEITYHSGVMDPVEESTLKAIKDLGIMSIHSVRTARKYRLLGGLTAPQLDLIVEKVLANKLIQHKAESSDGSDPSLRSIPEKQFKIFIVDLKKATDQQLKKISREGQLFLNLPEMKAIQQYFRKSGRNPTDCELETVAQTWSEHCYHKTFKGHISYQSKENGRAKSRIIKDLFQSTIKRATEKVKKSWCVSVFHDNAGVIRFDQDYHVCFKVETHNHPSALEPFGGANTGVGGVVRDILGTGLGARPICNTDVFCFGSPDFPFEKLPEGTLHPKRIMKGVIRGVRDYGNKMGIPTVNGAIVFDDRYVGNPLVYCGTVGIIPKDRVIKKVRPGDLIVTVGGRTGRDGIHGATFSSGELTSESGVISSGAVQIGHPIQEKKMMDTLIQARDQQLYSAITDCGAGGFSSAIGEMGKDLGARVHLEKAPLKYAGLNYTEIWISESQERMILAVPPKNKEALLKIFADENVEAAVLGEFTGTKRLELFYQEAQVGDLGMEFLHEGIPIGIKKAYWAAPRIKEPSFQCPADLTAKLKECLSHYNVASKEWVIRQYDHEVQGGTIIKPLVGLAHDGPSDASVMTPILGSNKGIAIANGINPRYGLIDPYWMAASCIDEAIRQIVAVGGDPDRIALLDNFCWGNPDKPDRLGSLVRAAVGCYETAVGYGVPFISGKDSLYNEFTQGKKSIAIPGTLLISAIGIIEDVRRCVTMDLKKPGHLIYIIGQTSDEMGGSIYFDNLNQLGGRVPRVNWKKGRRIFQALRQAARKGVVASLHDCSEGGLAVACAEMAFSGGYGMSVRLKDVPYRGEEREDYILFSESNTRFIVEVSSSSQKKFETLLKGVPWGLIGRVEDAPQFKIYGFNGQLCVQSSLADLKESWQRPLRW